MHSLLIACSQLTPEVCWLLKQLVDNAGCMRQEGLTSPQTVVEDMHIERAWWTGACGRACEEELEPTPASSRFQPGRTPSVSCFCSSGSAMLLLRDTLPPSERAGDGGGCVRRGVTGRLRVTAGGAASLKATAAAQAAARQAR